MTIKLKCLVDHPYGNRGRMSPPEAKKMGYDPKLWQGGVVTTFKAGEEYDLEDRLAKRLLRDYGVHPDRTKPGQVRFEPADKDVYIAMLQAEVAKIPMAAVLAGALAARNTDDGVNHDVDPGDN